MVGLGKGGGYQQTMVCRFEPFVPMVVLVGVMREGIEITATCMSKPQSHWPNMELHCPYGNVSVMLSVCHTSSDLLSILKSTPLSFSNPAIVVIITVVSLPLLPRLCGRFSEEGIFGNVVVAGVSKGRRIDGSTDGGTSILNFLRRGLSVVAVKSSASIGRGG